MPVLLFQIFIVFTLVVARQTIPKAMIYLAGAWTIFSLIMIFMPWLMILQLSIIWGAYFLIRPKRPTVVPAVRPVVTKRDRS